MKMYTVMLLAVVSTLALSTSANAEFGGGPRGLFGPGAGFPGPELMFEHIADHLELDDTQRESVQNILEAAKPELEALRDQARSNREALMALDTSDAAYSADVNNIAISNGHYAVGKYLLDRGADPNVRNVDGLTPLWAIVNMRFAPVSWAPNPRTDQEEVDSLELIQALLGSDQVGVDRPVFFRLERLETTEQALITFDFMHQVFGIENILDVFVAMRADQAANDGTPAAAGQNIRQHRLEPQRLDYANMEI